ncbi:MAG: cob(I)yrinic acid a,c-diamide adenosyltransferase [Owenweeksia sp.]|nr:cob(I)yrinic acid a,c-diamide adenosyltransferase [Owenweeksia sp.]
MKIYTRKGDTGETSLIGGVRVSKTHLRIEAYGTVDELNSCLGLLRDAADHEGNDNFLVSIQHQLFTIGSELASSRNSKMEIPHLTDEHIEALEREMDRMDNELPELRNFILPGGDLASSHCHLARCVCRRAERRVVALATEEAVDEKIVRYLNRLSDFLFVLARFFTHQHGGEETPWKTRS